MNYYPIFITAEQEEHILKHMLMESCCWDRNYSPKNNVSRKYGYAYKYKPVWEMPGLPDIVVKELKRLHNENTLLKEQIDRMETGDEVYYSKTGDYDKDNSIRFREEIHIPIPEWLTDLHTERDTGRYIPGCTKVNETFPEGEGFNQIIIDKFGPGEEDCIHMKPIADPTEFGNTIVIIGLGTKSTITFKRGKERIIHHCLERCSALVLTGDNWDNWKYSIPPRKHGTRFCITFMQNKFQQQQR